MKFVHSSNIPLRRIDFYDIYYRRSSPGTCGLQRGRAVVTAVCGRTRAYVTRGLHVDLGYAVLGDRGDTWWPLLALCRGHVPRVL